MIFNLYTLKTLTIKEKKRIECYLEGRWCQWRRRRHTNSEEDEEDEVDRGRWIDYPKLVEQSEKKNI